MNKTKFFSGILSGIQRFFEVVLRGVIFPKFTNAQEAAEMAGLTSGDAGLFWYNSDLNVLAMWDGTAIQYIQTKSSVETYSSISGWTGFVSIQKFGRNRTIHFNLTRSGADVSELRFDIGADDLPAISGGLTIFQEGINTGTFAKFMYAAAVDSSTGNEFVLNRSPSGGTILTNDQMWGQLSYVV